MVSSNRSAKINVKVLVVLLVIVAAIGVSLFAARHVRTRLLSQMDLSAGQAAYENKDWPAAYRHFQGYLGRNPDDLEILKKYAEARLSIRPLDSGNVMGAISAYRRVIRLDSQDEIAYEELARLYTAIENFDELRYIARKRIDLNIPEDHKARLWLYRALVGLDKMDDANEVELERFIAELDEVEEKPGEYVQACALMSKIILDDDPNDSDVKRARQFLTDAVVGVPKSVEALANRARFYRGRSEMPRTTEQEKLAALAAARSDLEAADKLGTDDPKIRSLLCVEWLAHGELDRAGDELQAVENLSQEVMEEHFFDVNDWTSTRFVLASELAMQKGDPNEAASLADKVLDDLTEKRHRFQVLDPAIISYVSAGNPVDANTCLDEYVDAMRSAGLTAQGRLRLAFLRALVAGAQDRPYAVIDILQPVLVGGVSNSRLWWLLAEAYGRTNQPSRAISALERYLRLRPQDSQARLQMAQEHRKLRDFNGVLEHAQQAESLNPADTGARLLRIEAGAHIAAGKGETGATRLKELSSELTELRQKHPEQVDIRILQATIALYLEQPDKDTAEAQAERELKLAIEECEEPFKAEMQLVRHYYRAKRITEAISTCKAACENHFEVAEPWLALADLHVANPDTNSDPNSARSCLEQGLSAVAEEGEKRALTIKLALLELTRGERTRGIDRLTELAAKDKQDIRVRSLLLRVREVLEDPAKAQQLVDELREAEGKNGVRWRFYQAFLWLSSDDWRSRQRDITDALQYCIDADPKWPEPVLLLGGMYYQLNDLQRVEDTYRRALARNSAATDVANALMTLLQRQNRLSDAEELLDQIKKASLEAASAKLKSVIKLEPTAVDAHLMLIGAAMQQGEYETARDLVIQAVGSNPDNSALLSAKGRAELALDDTKMAAQSAQLALEEDPNNVAARDVLVAAALRLTDGSLDKTATELIHRTLEDDPNNAWAKDAIVALALKSADRALLEEARALIESALGSNPTDEQMLLSRARILISLGLPQTAIPELETCCQTEAGRNSIDAIVMLANLHRLSGDMDRAKRWIEQAENKDLTNQTVVHARFLWLVAKERFDELAQISSAYISAKEQDPRTVVAAASVLAARDSIELKKEAEKLFEHAVKLSPTLLGARLGLASTLYQIGNVERAKKIYQESLEQNPYNARILNDLAWILQEHDKSYDAALELANKALSVNSDDVSLPNLLDTRGTILLKLGRFDDAKIDFEQLLQLLPDDSPQRARALLHLGRVCAELNDLTKAEEYLNEALDIHRKIDVFTVDERSEIAEILQRSEK